MSVETTEVDGGAARKLVRSKYIIIKHAGGEVPLVFSPLLSHEHVAGMREVLSAGYCRRDAAGRWTASGGSESLGLKARPQDADILNERLFI
jgi:hypothetical protein